MHARHQEEVRALYGPHDTKDATRKEPSDRRDTHEGSLFPERTVLVLVGRTRASMLKRYITIYSRWRRWLREGKNAFPFGRQPELADSFWLGKVADFDPHRRATEGRMVPAIKDTIVAVALVVLVLILLVIL